MGGDFAATQDSTTEMEEGSVRSLHGLSRKQRLDRLCTGDGASQDRSLCLSQGRARKLDHAVDNKWMSLSMFLRAQAQPSAE